MLTQNKTSSHNTNGIYHVVTRSIARFTIFNDSREYDRFIKMLRFFIFEKIHIRFSNIAPLYEEDSLPFDLQIEKFSQQNEKRVTLIAFCLMPNHIHLILHQVKDGGISKFMSDLLNSYTRYFNLKHKRKGPLWEGRFRSIACESDEQLLHLTRYIHLNPVTAYLVDKPQDWIASSYLEYINQSQGPSLCEFKKLISFRGLNYSEFVENRINDQRVLAEIKRLALE